MIKYKKCKGQNKAINFVGCGQEVYVRSRVYGLCQDCFKKWLYSTEEGKEHIQKSITIGREKLKKQSRKESRERKDDLKKKLMTKTQAEKRLQYYVNKIVRTIDEGCDCISSGIPLPKNFDAGHYYSVGSNATIRFNFHNIFGQSVQENMWMSGNPIGYQEGLIKTFGQEYADKVFELKQIKPLKRSKDQILALTTTAREILKHVKQCKAMNINALTPKERIKLREYAQRQLGLYPTFYDYEQEWL